MGGVGAVVVGEVVDVAVVERGVAVGHDAGVVHGGEHGSLEHGGEALPGGFGQFDRQARLVEQDRHDRGRRHEAPGVGGGERHPVGGRRMGGLRLEQVDEVFEGELHDAGRVDRGDDPAVGRPTPHE